MGAGTGAGVDVTEGGAVAGAVVAAGASVDVTEGGAIAGAVAGAALMSSNANAAFDPSTALTGASAEGNIETVALWMLGTVVVIWGVRKVIGFFSR